MKIALALLFLIMGAGVLFFGAFMIHVGLAWMLCGVGCIVIGLNFSEG